MPQRIRAGCDAMCATLMLLMRSLPQRIRAGCDGVQPQQARSVLPFATAHSRGLRRQLAVTGHTHVPLPQRIRAGCDQCANNLRQPDGALPQRIRAGCDVRKRLHRVHGRSLPQRIRAGCDRLSSSTSMRVTIFATAHSRGLRPSGGQLIKRIGNFATAHSCGLRRGHDSWDFCSKILCHSAFVRVATWLHVRLKCTNKPLPQRIRAGCDCGKAMQRTANLLREGR